MVSMGFVLLRLALNGAPLFAFNDNVVSKKAPPSARLALNLPKTDSPQHYKQIKREVNTSLFICRWGDLNPHGFLHTPLKRARLPFRHIDMNVICNFQLVQCPSVAAPEVDSRSTLSENNT